MDAVLPSSSVLAPVSAGASHPIGPTLTADGVNLVSNTYAQLAYIGGAQNGTYGSITTQDVNPNNGSLIGTPQAMSWPSNVPAQYSRNVVASVMPSGTNQLLKEPM